MNKARRDTLRTAIELLERVSTIVCNATDEEQDCIDNMPENMQDGEKYQKMEEAVGHLEDAAESIESAISSVEVAVQ